MVGIDDGIDVNPITDILDTDITTNFAENTGVQIEGLPTQQFFEPIIEVPTENIQIKNVETTQRTSKPHLIVGTNRLRFPASVVTTRVALVQLKTSLHGL